MPSPCTSGGRWSNLKRTRTLLFCPPLAILTERCGSWYETSGHRGLKFLGELDTLRILAGF